jgi:hypothetical protein
MLTRRRGSQRRTSLLQSLLFVAVASQIAGAQAAVKYRVPGARWDRVYHVSEVSCGTCGSYVFSGISHGADGVDHPWIFELDANTRQQKWAKIYDIPDQRYLEPAGMARSADGGFAIAFWGQSSSESVKDRSYVLKVDKAGSVEWAKRYEYATPAATDLSMRDIQPSPSGGFIVGGSIGFLNPTTSVYTVDAWLAKLDDDGNIEWQRRYDGGKREILESVRPTSGGGYIWVGVHGSSPTPNDYDGLAVRTLWSGVIDWQKTYVATEYDILKTVEESSPGVYIVGAMKQERPWLLQLDNGGNIQWQKTYGSGYGNIVSVKPAASGGFYATGISSIDANSSRIQLIRTNATGDVTWRREYGDEYTATPYALHLAKDGSAIMLGSTRPGEPSPDRPYGDSWVLYADASDGSLGDNCSAALAPDTPATDVPTVTAATASLTMSDGSASVSAINVITRSVVIEVLPTCPKPIQPWEFDWRFRQFRFPHIPPFDFPFDPRLPPSPTPPEPCPPFCPIVPLTTRPVVTGDLDLLRRLKDVVATPVAAAAAAAERSRIQQALARLVQSNERLSDQLKAQWTEVLRLNAKWTPRAGPADGRLASLYNETAISLLGGGPTNRVRGTRSGPRVELGGFAIVETGAQADSVIPQLQLELVNGLPAFAAGYQPVGPLVTYSFRGLPRNARPPARVSIYYGGSAVSDTAINQLHILGWDGNQYRDLTVGRDPLTKTITATAASISKFVIMKRNPVRPSTRPP